MTLIIGIPDETDENVMATLDLIYEVERRGLAAREQVNMAVLACGRRLCRIRVALEPAPGAAARTYADY